MDLQLRKVAGNLTFTAGTVTAWYTLPERVWAFRPDADREAWLLSIAGQFAGLAGCRVHLRRTTRPYPVGQWAGNLLHSARPYGPDLVEYVQAAARHLDASAPTEGLTMVGVTIARRQLGDVLGDVLAGWLRRRNTGTEQGRLDDRIQKITDVLAPPGLGASPTTPTELAWLIYRSVGLGLTPPDWRAMAAGPDDIIAYTEHVDRYRSRYGSTVRLVNRLTGEDVHVAVLTVGQMQPLTIPQEHQPWMHLADRSPFPVELSSRVDVLGPGAAAGSLNKRLLIINSQRRDYGEHELHAPPELERLEGRALQVGDEVSTGMPVDSARVHGWHRLAVVGGTEREALDRADELRRLYHDDCRMALQHPKDQDALAREFIPGEPVADTGYLRRMPVKLFAAAVPQAVAAVGDGRGDLIGHVAGAGYRPVMFDPHFPTEVRERSGLSVFVAEPGGGKSTLIGTIGYRAARRGVQTTILDPSGPLARLAAMPALRGRSRVVNLAGSEPGTLAPYALIPTPTRQHFAPGVAGEREFESAVANARAERKMLVLDICAMLLPPAAARSDATAMVLRDAVRAVPAEEFSTLDQVVQALIDAGSVEAKNVANLLLDAAELPLARLLFGRPQRAFADDTPLTVITMAGLRLPDMNIERDYWSVEEALALPMLHLAHRLAVRRCYGGGNSGQHRKLVALDEAHVMEGWPSGRSFLVRLARDSRKWNIAALVASQNPRDILNLDMQNLVSTVFAGRIADDAEVAAEALRLLRVPTGDGYEQMLAGLSQHVEGSHDRLGFREFVMRDVDGRVQRIRVDLSWDPELLAHLDTTPVGGVR